ncbi:MAG: T9SS type A sorting domain-containing protein, partial [Bacteroidota bacterium]
WDFGDGGTAVTNGTGSSATHTYAGFGTYLVTLISIAHIDDSVCCVDTVSKEIKIGPSDQRLGVHPSITEGEIEVDYDLISDQPVTVSIEGTDGRVYARYEAQSRATRQFEVRDLPAGIYFVRVRNADTMLVKKFLKR